MAEQNSLDAEILRLEKKLGISRQEQAPEEAVPEVLDEPADISAADRALVKNFGGTQEEQVAYLQNKYGPQQPGEKPKLEVASLFGEIVARKPGEKAYKKLDPGGLAANLNPIEMAKDLADVGVDLFSSAASTAAGAAGGLLSAPTIAGAIPGAMAAGGAASAGLELIRQQIGQKIMGGQDKGLLNRDVIVSGLLGSLGAPLAGAGFTAKQVGKAVKSPDVVRRVLEKAKIEAIPEGAKITSQQTKLAADLITKSGEGLIGKLPKWAISQVSGVPSETLKTATNVADQTVVKKLRDVGGIKLNPNKKYTNLEISDWLEEGGVGALGKIAQAEFVEPVKEALRKTGKLIDEGIKTATEAGKKVSIAKHAEPLDDLYVQLSSAARESDSVALREAADKVKSLREKYFTAGVEEVSPKTAFQLKQQLADLIDFNRTPVEVSSQLESAISRAEKGLRDDIYNVIEGDAARKAYAEHSDIMEGMYKFFKNTDTAVNTLKNPETLRSPSIKRQIAEFDKNYTASLGPMADIATTWKFFGRPPTQPVVGGGSGQFWRGAGLFGSLGALASSALGIPPAIGGAVGGLLGGFATSPYVIKGGLKAETAAAKAAGKLGNLPIMRQLVSAPGAVKQRLPEFAQPAISAPGAYQSIWQLMGMGETK